MTRYSYQKDFLSMSRIRMLIDFYDAIEKYGAGYNMKRMTEEDAKRLLSLAKANGGLIKEYKGTELNLNLFKKDMDFSEFEKLYGSDVLLGAVLDAQKDAVMNNKLLNRFQARANGLGLSANYRVVSDAHDPENNGIYFVFGARYRYVFDDNLDIEKLLKSQQKNYSSRMDLHAVKLTGSNPFAAHNEVYSKMFEFQFIKAMVMKYNITRQEYYRYLTNNSVDKAKMYYKGYLNSNYSWEQRQANQNSLGRTMNMALETGAKYDFKTAFSPDEIMKQELSLFNDNQISLKEMIEKCFGLEGVKYMKLYNKEMEGYLSEMRVPDFLNNVKEVGILKLSKDFDKDKLASLIGSLDVYQDILYSRIKDKNGDDYFLFDNCYKDEVMYRYLLASYPDAKENFDIDIGHTDKHRTVVMCGIHMKDIQPLSDELQKRYGNRVQLCLLNDTTFMRNNTEAEYKNGDYIVTVAFFNHIEKEIRDCADELGIELINEPKKEQVRYGMFKISGSKDMMDEISKKADAKGLYYFKSKPQGVKGIATKKDNASFTVMEFNMKDRDFVERCMLEYKHPELFQVSYPEMKQKIEKMGDKVLSVAVNERSLNYFLEKMDRQGVPYTVNEKNLFCNDYLNHPWEEKTYNILFPSYNLRDVAKIVEYVTFVDEKETILYGFEKDDYYKNLKSEDEQIQEMKDGRWDNEER